MMATRREMLATGLKAGAAGVLSRIFIERNLLAQMTPREGRHRGEMMLNSSPRHDVYPLPNFEPASKVLDMNEDDIASNEVTERDRVVSQTYKNFLDAASDNPAVKLMPMWGTSDRMMWLNDGPTHHRKQPNRAQRSLPFDTEYRPTPAFLAMRNNFNVHTI